MPLCNWPADEEETNFPKNVDCNSSKSTSQHPRTSSLAASQNASQLTLSRSKKPTTKTSVNIFKNQNYSMASHVNPTTASLLYQQETPSLSMTWSTSTRTSQNCLPVSF